MFQKVGWMFSESMRLINSVAANSIGSLYSCEGYRHTFYWLNTYFIRDIYIYICIYIYIFMCIAAKDISTLFTNSTQISSHLYIYIYIYIYMHFIPFIHLPLFIAGKDIGTLFTGSTRISSHLYIYILILDIILWYITQSHSSADIFTLFINSPRISSHL